MNELVASPRNVRRLSNAQADLKLKAETQVHCLLQHLVVAILKKLKGSFANAR